MISKEELEARKSARSTTPEEKRDKCPECGSVKVYERVGGFGCEEPRSDKDFRCGACDSDFDEPIKGEKA